MEHGKAHPTVTDPSDYISFTQAARLAPGKPHPSAIWRWARRGIQARNGERVKLQHIRAGRRCFTTAAWLDDYTRRLTAADADAQADDRLRDDLDLAELDAELDADQL